MRLLRLYTPVSYFIMKLYSVGGETCCKIACNNHESYASEGDGDKQSSKNQLVNGQV